MSAARSTRFTPPASSALAPRPRLVEQLVQADGHSWLWAPGGYGKTSLAAETVRAAGVPYAWYRIDSHDADPPVFFENLALAMRDLGRASLPRLTVERQGDISHFARDFGAALGRRVPPACFIVLDDYHLLANDSPLHRAIPALAEVLPAGVRWLVTSRQAPPDDWARLDASHGLSLLGAETLALSEDEATIIAQRHRPGLAADTVRQLHARTGGWMAGLILLLRTGSHAGDSGTVSPDRVFRYFNNELMRDLDARTCTFLRKLALLPHANAGMATELTGERDARGILSSLHRANLFIARHRLWNHAYELHPLFREFLLDDLAKSVSPSALAGLQRKAGELLARHGEPASAIDLLLAGGDADAAAQCCEEHAAAWLEQGRWASLLGWLRRLPAGVRARRPWANYWMGMCLLHNHTQQARECLVEAWDAFRAAGDHAGLHLAWCAVVQTYLFEFGTYTGLDRWLDAWHTLIRQLPRPSLAVRVRQKVLLFSALMFRRPQDPAFPALEKALYRLVFWAPLKPAQRLQVAAHLLRYYAWTGDLGRTRLVVDRLRRSAQTAELDPFSRQLWFVVEAMYSWYGVSPREGMAIAERGLAAAQDSGMHLMDFTLLIQKAYAAFALDDQAAARDAIARMEPTLSEERLVHFGHYQFFLSWLAFIDDDPATALTRMETDHGLALTTGSPYVLAQSDYGFAEALFRNGRLAEAHRINDAALAIATQCSYRPQRYLLLLNRAQFAQASGDLPLLDATLREALALGARREFHHVPFWSHRDFSPLLAYALEHDIEPAFVHAVIRGQQMRPYGSALDSPAWPRPVTIRALGGFGVSVAGEPLSTGGKQQRRPLDLLKLLLVTPGLSLADAAVQLWPEADADNAANNLKITLSRLRKLVGHEAVRLQDGRLSLDRGWCGCDLWGLQARLAVLERDGLERDRSPLPVPADIHPGDLLPDDNHLAPVLHAREQLRQRVLRVLRREATRLLAEDPAGALAVARRGATLDPLSEPFHQLAIRALLALDRPSEAVRAYRQLQAILQEQLGLKPSPATRALLAGLIESP
jgi:DNA-binding SARP family transcriptional activator